MSCITCDKHLALDCPFFASNLVKGVHARAQSPLPSRPFSGAQDHFRVSGVSLDGLKKRVTAGSLSVQKAFYISLSICFVLGYYYYYYYYYYYCYYYYYFYLTLKKFSQQAKSRIFSGKNHYASHLRSCRSLQ